MRQLFLESPVWLVGGVVTILMVVAAEVGYHVGKRSVSCNSGVGAVKASALALVGLLLAFSYSIAAGHYDRRKQVVVGEAKALRASWLRTDLADDSSRSRARALIRSIVDARLQSFDRTAGAGAGRLADQQVYAAQSELWALAADQMRQSKEPEKHMLLALAVSDVVDRTEERAAAVEYRVPAPVLYLLTATILMSGFLVGLSSGQDNRRIPLLWGIVIALMVAVLVTIFDLDNPGRGIVPDRPKPLEDLSAQIS
jgi:hypothetical protein